MLAIITTKSLISVDPSVLKRAVSSSPSPSSSSSSCALPTRGPSTDLLERPTALAWSPDGSVYVAVGKGVLKYETYESDAGLNKEETEVEARLVYICDSPISGLAVKDHKTIVVSAESMILLVDVTTGAGVQIVEGEGEGLITSLSMSTDTASVATTSSAGASLHSLSASTSTSKKTLLPIPKSLQHHRCTTSFFHPHTTKLLVGCGGTLVVYQDCKVLKSVVLSPTTEHATEADDIIAISASPFSKTLVACCTGSGKVGLVDLEKDKGLFRSITLPATLASLAFSPEGAALYLGTDAGRLLVLDLRALDKDPKSFVVGQGESVLGLAVQKKSKPAPAPVARTLKPSASTTSPVTLSAARRVVSTSTSARTGLVSRNSSPLSPARDPLGNTSSAKPKPKTSALGKTSTTAARVVNKASTTPTSSGRLASLGARARPSARVVSGTAKSTTPTGPTMPMPMTPPPKKKLAPRSGPVETELETGPEPESEAGTGMGLLGLTTPEVKKWIASEKMDKGKGVEFADKEEDGEGEEDGDNSVVIHTPGRQFNSNSWAPSPLRRVLGSPGGAAPLQAQDFLKSILRDVLGELQQEQCEQLDELASKQKDMHLDILRAHYRANKEFRDFREEMREEMKELREENGRLREENERLRRGY